MFSYIALRAVRSAFMISSSVSKICQGSGGGLLLLLLLRLLRLLWVVFLDLFFACISAAAAAAAAVAALTMAITPLMPSSLTAGEQVEFEILTQEDGE